MVGREHTGARKPGGGDHDRIQWLGRPARADRRPWRRLRRILGQGASDVWNETPLDLPGGEPDPAADPDWGPPPANPDGDASSGDIVKALEQAGGALGEDGGMPGGDMSETGGHAYEIQPDQFQPIDQM